MSDSNSKPHLPSHFPEAHDSNIWCQTDGDQSISGSNKSSFVWKIKNFKDRPEQKGEFVSSKVFRINGSNDFDTKWILRVYPKGRKVRVECLNEVNVNADINLFAIKNGRKFKIELTNVKRELASSVGFRPDQYLQNGDLILMCELTVLACENDAGYNLKGHHNAQMLRDLEESFKESLGFDVKINCGDVSFECSKFMLMTRSTVFKSMFQSNMVESQSNIIDIADMKPEVVSEMLQYIHTGNVLNIEKMPRDLLAAADRYQLAQLKTSCQEILIETLDIENCIPILILSDMHNALKLRRGALKFATENMKAISNLCDWKKELTAFPFLMADMIEMFTTMI